MNQKCAQVKNLEQTPFIDLTKKKNYLEMKLRKQNFDFVYDEQSIDWKIIKPSKKYKDEKFHIPDQQVRQQIDKILALFKNHQTFDISLRGNTELLQLLQQKKDEIQKYSNQKFPKAVVTQFLFIFHPKLQSQISKDNLQNKLEEIVKQTEFPLASVLLSLMLIKNGVTGKKVQDLFKKAVQFGECFAFQHYGYYLYTQQKYNKAYQMYKNAEKKGYIPLIYFRLGEYFSFRQNMTYPENAIAAKKYFDLVKNSKIEPNKNLKDKIKYFYQYLQYGQKQAQKIKSTFQIQAKVVGNFFRSKFTQQQLAKMHTQSFMFKSTSNLRTGGEYFCYTPKIFYVVCSPVLYMPSRGFLVEDDKGAIESIYIYNWDQIHPNLLKLLHTLGTKVIIKQYIRKYGINDQLPMYRVENPYAVQIHPQKQRHFISDQKFRNFARSLFSNGLFQHCKAIYKHLIQKQASQLEIIYSNLGLISEKQLNIFQAKQYYLKSIKVKKYDKSLYRLARILLQQQNFIQAEKLCEQIQGETQQKQLEKLITEKKKRYLQNQLQYEKSVLELQKTQISAQMFIRKRKQKKYIIPKKNDNKISIFPTQFTTAIVGQTAKYFLLQKYQLSNLLNLQLNLSPEKFITQIQNIFNSAENPLTKQNLPYITNFFKLSYYSVRKFSQKIFDQSFTYSQYYWSLCEGRPLQSVSFQNQICCLLSMRCHYLQYRIQNHCIELQNKCNYDQALLIYESTNNTCIQFSIKIAQILIKLQKYKQSLSYCTQILQKYQKYINQPYIFPHLLSIKQYQIENMIKLQQYQSVIVSVQKFIKSVDKQNPKYISINVDINFNEQKGNKSNKNPSYIQLLQDYDKYVKLVHSDLQITILKYNLLYCYYMLGRQDNLINKTQIQILRNSDKELYFLTIFLKIKIYQKLQSQQVNKKSIVNYLGEGVQYLSQFVKGGCKIQQKAVIIKELINSSIREEEIELSFEYAHKLIELNSKYSSFFVARLSRLIKQNKKIPKNFFKNLQKLGYPKIAYILEQQYNKQGHHL